MARILSALQRLALVFVMTVSAYPALAAVPGTPEAFVENLVGRALADLRGDLPKAELNKRFGALVAQNFDIPFISRSTLGSYWDAATEPERSDFQSLFAEFLVQAHANHFSEFAGQTVQVTGSRSEGDTIVVTSQLLEAGSSVSRVQLNWVLRQYAPLQTGTSFRIVDVAIVEIGEGRTSLAKWHQDEVRAVIRHQRFTRLTELNAFIRQKLRTM